MQYLAKSPPNSREIIRLAATEIDARQLALLTPLSTTECLTLLFDLCDFVRDLAFSVERQETPEASDQEIGERLRYRLEPTHAKANPRIHSNDN